MTTLNLTYPGGVVVEYGKPLSPTRVATAPAVAFALEPDRDAHTLHTLLLVDPDAPFRDSPSAGEWVHWLVYDIPGNETSQGKTLIEYAPPAPRACPRSEKLCLQEHRLTFILWEQPHGPLHLHASDVAISASDEKGRAQYKARDFASRHRLGMHIGMNFFETWHDPADGTFGAHPWWHVTDDHALRQVGHLIPHVVRGDGDGGGGGKDEL